MSHARRRLSLRMDLDQCQHCKMHEPLPDEVLCLSCFAAAQHCTPLFVIAACPCCQQVSDLYASDYFPREDPGLCFTHILIKTQCEMERRKPDCSHIGDARNCQ
jgi:hypothetical protein